MCLGRENERASLSECRSKTDVEVQLVERRVHRLETEWRRRSNNRLPFAENTHSPRHRLSQHSVSCIESALKFRVQEIHCGHREARSR